jgi:hypothetical protein
MKYTKGKWMIGKAGKYHWQIISDIPSKIMLPGLGIRHDPDTLIADLQWDDFCNEDETEANAKLISKAPKMYQALKFIEELYSKSYVILPEDYKKIESLIKEIES